ncbi:MAG TPA: hypothetical protein VFJ85_08920 [Acidimicrobiales bacterium]|nr:hypothetical protein [Acidimicrobiales bacterium]
MSTLWTPGGERPVGGGGSGPSRPAPEPDAVDDQEDQEELEAKMAELRQKLAETPAAVIVANHCFGLFELAALHLSLQPPQLTEAQVAIDALGAVVDGVAGRLGPEEQHLRDGLAQLRLAYVQLKGAMAAGGPAGEGAGGA